MSGVEYVYASLLLHHAGKPITEENIRKVLEAIGVEVDDVKVKAVAAALSGVDIEEAIKSAGVPVMATAAAMVPASQAPEAPAAGGEEEERKEEEEKEEAEEEIAEGLAALFG